VARVVTEQMGNILGQSMVIENVGGAGGTIGARASLQRPPTDTRSLPGAWDHTSRLPCSPQPEIRLRARFRANRLHRTIASRHRRAQGFPANNLREFVDYLKQNGDRVKQAHAGSVRRRTWHACSSLRRPASSPLWSLIEAPRPR